MKKKRIGLEQEQKATLWLLAAAAVLTVAVRLLPLASPWKTLLFLVPYLLVGWDVLREAGEGILEKRPFDECFLMAVATIGALALSDGTEAVAVMGLYRLGELFEEVATDKSRDSIRALMDIRPDVAFVERDGSLLAVSPETLGVGDRFVVRAGEKIPLDGTVLGGDSTVDTAALTGESLPRAVGAGERVQSGCVNLSGTLTVRADTPFLESTASKILALMESAQEKKAVAESFITKFSRVYTPIVCALAAALALLLPTVRLALGLSPAFGIWVYRALTFLVISCPCALVISIPLTFFAGIGGAARVGILIKGGNYFEQLSRVKTVAFDKTGTVTEGTFAVTDICPREWMAEALLEIAALVELDSHHPIAESLKSACTASLDRARVTAVKTVSGEGVTALVDGVPVFVGNRRLMQAAGVTVPESSEQGTTVYVAADGVYRGYLCIADAIKPSARPALAALYSLGVRESVMLTGDNRKTAHSVAEALGVRTVHAELLPGEKVAVVEALLDGDGTVAFVGDGLNDAPVLARADIGIAMGARGADAAIEAADVVLMDDDPNRLVTAIRHSRRTMAIVRQNIVFALCVKAACLLLGACGLASMWVAVVADVGVMVLAVLNAMRAFWVKEG